MLSGSYLLNERRQTAAGGNSKPDPEAAARILLSSQAANT
jgi:hypothetical protein